MTLMRDHLAECAKCAGRDSEIRRALLLVKNLPSVQVSDGFEDRLRARIATERAAPPASQGRRYGALKWAVAAGFLFVVAGGIMAWPPDGSEASPPRLPAVVASVPGVTTGDESAYMASMSTGIPMWPALMLAEEGPLRFAAGGLQNARWDGTSRQD
jgi:anti-sigma factor RsiW